MNLLDKISLKSVTVGIIGLGYVGLPLVIRFRKAGYAVIGFDIGEEKIKALIGREDHKSNISHRRTCRP